MGGANSMHSKVVTFEIKPGRRDEVIRLFQKFVIPGALSKQKARGGD